MGIVSVPTFGADPVTITGPTLDAKVDGLATEFNGNIDNDNIKSAAAIANSKLNLGAISQNIAHSGTMSHTGVVTLTKNLKLAKGADVASANALTLGTDGNYFDITGTTAITSIGTLGVGTVVKLHFDGILTFTHHATDLILPGGANITTAAGDEAELVEYASGDWRCTSYVKASGLAVVASSPTVASQANMEAASDNTVMVTPLAVNWHPGVAKAWILFNGTGTAAITSSYNITSITDNGTGDYTITIATDFSGSNYCATHMVEGRGAGEDGVICTIDYDNAPTATALRIRTKTEGNVDVDIAKICVAMFGDQA